MSAKATVLRAADCERITADWGGLTWYASGKLGNSGEMTVGKCVILPGHETPLHSHPNCSETLVVTAGRVAHLIEDGSRVELGPGDTITVPAGIVHNARCISAEPAEMFIAFSSADRRMEKA
jgi:quercetin dioxygenase-like cupin family protein